MWGYLGRPAPSVDGQVLQFGLQKRLLIISYWRGIYYIIHLIINLSSLFIF